MVDHAWLDAVPDVPRWVEVRSILLQGNATLLGTPDAGFVLDGKGLLGGIVGRPDRATIEDALRTLGPDAEVLVPSESLARIRFLLPDLQPRRAIIHRRVGAAVLVEDPAITVEKVDGQFLSSLPRELAEELEGADWAAISRVGAVAVAICGAYWPTERWWDVGVDTLTGHRRLGHATRCFHALDGHMSLRGLEPVWGAYEDNVASLSMASSLGFEPVDELYVLERSAVKVEAQSG